MMLLVGNPPSMRWSRSHMSWELLLDNTGRKTPTVPKIVANVHPN